MAPEKMKAKSRDFIRGSKQDWVVLTFWVSIFFRFMQNIYLRCHKRTSQYTWKVHRKSCASASVPKANLTATVPDFCRQQPHYLAPADSANSHLHQFYEVWHRYPRFR